MIYDHWSFIFAGKGKAKQLEQSYDWQSNRQDGWLGFVFFLFFGGDLYWNTTDQYKCKIIDINEKGNQLLAVSTNLIFQNIMMMVEE